MGICRRPRGAQWGPAAAATQAHLAELREHLAADMDWRDERHSRIDSSARDSATVSPAGAQLIFNSTRFFAARPTFR